MVHNLTRIAQLPFSNAQMSAHTRVMRGKGIGCGMGSILLRRGGAGAASSYQDIDDYVSQTGINPYSRGKAKGQGLGTGMDRMREKLQKLTVEQPSTTKPKVRKIQMSM
jgi:hypothetical protein